MFTFVGEQCIRALFTDPQISFFINFFIKNGSHGTIYTFKNYFTTVISAKSFQFQQNKFYPNRPSISLNSKARQLLPSIASEDHQFRRDLPSSRWKMLKIVSPSHCFQPPTPEVFSPLPTPNVARRSSLSFFFFFIFFFFSKFFFLQICVLCFKKLTYTFICLIKCFSEDDCANNFF